MSGGAGGHSTFGAAEQVFTAAKALWGGALAFVVPGAAYLLLNLDDGLTGRELIGALLTAIVTAGSVGGTVYAVKNKPVPPPPSNDDLRPPPGDSGSWVR